MKRRFSFGITVLLMLVVIFTLGILLAVAIGPTILPSYIPTFLGMLLGALAIEVANKYGPKSFPSVLTTIQSYSRRDKLVLLTAYVTGTIIIFLPFQIYRASLLILVPVFLIALIIMSGIVWLFGSKKLRRGIFTKTAEQNPKEENDKTV
jgi:uncharacterized membrane protein YoaK (UPF0700 family)